MSRLTVLTGWITSIRPRPRRWPVKRVGGARGGDRRAEGRTLREKGSATLEAAIIVPSLLGIGVLLVFAGRSALAQQAVEQASWEVAREASIARNATTAQINAVTRGEALLADLGCVRSTVAVDTSGFAVPPGQPAAVAITVTCTMNLGGLVFPGIPGEFTFSAHETSPIDTYRQHS
ncbi:MAG: pilus assembly protein [Propionibacteriaceae bacterium]|jgi:hypothetical protein|nr:pilus assembly protein [Propionibacteriaceae bacterium]